jgi:hypothetical protein
MYQQGSSQDSVKADLWFCLHPGCPNRIIGTFDPRIVMRAHSDHQELKNFRTFNESHLEFLAMVESGDLSSP